jgi:hypothetical protein
MSDRITIRPATADDIRGFYPAGLGRSVRAWVAEVEGDVQAIAGVLATGEYLLVFSDMKAGAGLPKLTIWRGAKMLLAKIAALNLPLLAVAHDCSGPFLMRLGFLATDDHGVFVWPTRQH